MSDWYQYNGTSGDDHFQGGDGFDIVSGHAGDDTLLGGGGGDMIYGGADSDRIYGEDGDDTLSGSGSGEHNLISGDAGNDYVIGRATDTMLGGDGVDELQLELGATTAALVLNLNKLVAGATLKFADGSRISGFEKGFIVLGSGADYVKIDDAGSFDVVTGAGDDTVLGGDGEDFMDGGLGDDRLSGGRGVDSIAFGSATSGITVSLAKTGVQNTRGGGRDDLSGFENIFGSNFVDRLTGDAGDNMMWGNGGFDFTAGVGDSLYGGAGDDKLNGGWQFGYGAYLDGGAGDDQLGFEDYTFTSNGDAQTLVGGKGQDDIYLSYESVAVYASVKDSTVRNPDHLRVKGTWDGAATIDLQLIDADVNVDGDQAFALVSAFSGNAGELVVSVYPTDAGGSETWVRMDVDGDGRADSVIIINGSHPSFDGFVF